MWCPRIEWGDMICDGHGRLILEHWWCPCSGGAVGVQKCPAGPTHEFGDLDRQRSLRPTILERNLLQPGSRHQFVTCCRNVSLQAALNFHSCIINVQPYFNDGLTLPAVWTWSVQPYRRAMNFNLRGTLVADLGNLTRLVRL
jgi:hypothetical protein